MTPNVEKYFELLSRLDELRRDGLLTIEAEDALDIEIEALWLKMTSREREMADNARFIVEEALPSR